MNTRDVSAQEVAYVLLFGDLFMSSRTFVRVNTTDSVQLLNDGRVSQSHVEKYLQRKPAQESLTMHQYYERGYLHAGNYHSRQDGSTPVVVASPYYKHETAEYFMQQVIFC